MWFSSNLNDFYDIWFNPTTDIVHLTSDSFMNQDSMGKAIEYVFTCGQPPKPRVHLSLRIMYTLSAVMLWSRYMTKCSSSSRPQKGELIWSAYKWSTFMLLLIRRHGLVYLEGQEKSLSLWLAHPLSLGVFGEMLNSNPLLRLFSSPQHYYKK